MGKKQKAKSVPAPQVSLWVGLCLFVLVFALGLALRLYRMDDESPWLDEVLTVERIETPGLNSYIASLKESNPSLTAGYFTILYYYVRLVDVEVYWMRALSVAADMAALTFVLVLGKRMFGWTAGLTAAAGIAVSKFHIYYAQELRPYAFVGLFSVLAMWGLFEWMCSRNRAWLAMNLLANVFLFWMQPLGALLIAAQFAILIAAGRFDARRLLLWFAGPIAILIAFLPWQNELKYYDTDSSMFWLVAPPLSDILKTILGVFTGSKYILWDRLPLVAGKPIFHYLVALAFLVLLSHAALRFLRSDFPGAKPMERNDQRFKLAFLLLWAFVPVVAAIAISYLYKPVFWSRYLIFCTPPLYLILGHAALYMNPLKLRYALFATLFVSYVALVATYTRPLRPDWSTAAGFVSAHATSEDLICFTPYYEEPMFDYYFDESPIQRIPFETLEQLERFIAGTDQAHRTKWVLVNSSLSFDLDEFLKKNGMLRHRQDFAAFGNHLAVFRIDALAQAFTSTSRLEQ